ncbi:MAG: DUF4834 family protein [Muribaculaceae bacterium]|nr:DUF4834 family protein [Muribaculaceae bacterium]
MITFFLTILIVYLTVYLLWPLLRAWLARYARRKMEERINEMFGMSGNSAPRSGAAPQQSHHAPRRGKIYGRDEGEYIEFEEIDIPLPPPPPTKHTPMEPQVSDAEWEEIDPR